MLIEQATAVDAEEILALQKLAYRREAETYRDYAIPPLAQTLAELAEDFGTHLFLKCTLDGRIVGSVKGQLLGGTCHIGRLIVHPDFQGRGIGTLLMAEIEAAFPGADRFELFTGHRSTGNIRLYERLGYRIFRTEAVNDRLTLTYMAKPRATRHEDRFSEVRKRSVTGEDNHGTI